METDPDHPIIERPWEYDITDFHYHHDLNDWRSSFIEIRLVKGDTVRALRFTQPRNLAIEDGFPEPTRGMSILDVRHRQMEDIGVEVADFEASSGKITFVAKSVFDVEQSK